MVGDTPTDAVVPPFNDRRAAPQEQHEGRLVAGIDVTKLVGCCAALMYEAADVLQPRSALAIALRTNAAALLRERGVPRSPEPWRDVLRECAEDLAAELDDRYGVNSPDGIHPAMEGKYRRDMDPVTRAMQILSGGEQVGQPEYDDAGNEIVATLQDPTGAAE